MIVRCENPSGSPKIRTLSEGGGAPVTCSDGGSLQVSAEPRRQSRQADGARSRPPMRIEPDGVSLVFGQFPQIFDTLHPWSRVCGSYPARQCLIPRKFPRHLNPWISAAIGLRPPKRPRAAGSRELVRSSALVRVGQPHAVQRKSRAVLRVGKCN